MFLPMKRLLEKTDMRMDQLCFDSTFESYQAYITAVEKTKWQRTDKENEFLQELINEMNFSLFRLNCFYEDDEMIEVEDDGDCKRSDSDSSRRGN